MWKIQLIPKAHSTLQLSNAHTTSTGCLPLHFRDWLTRSCGWISSPGYCHCRPRKESKFKFWILASTEADSLGLVVKLDPRSWKSSLVKWRVQSGLLIPGLSVEHPPANALYSLPKGICHINQCFDFYDKFWIWVKKKLSVILWLKKKVYNFVPSVLKYNDSLYNFGYYVILLYYIMPHEQQTYNIMSICISFENISVQYSFRHKLEN